MKKERQKNKILFLIQLPPPIHGVSVINEHIYNLDIFNGPFRKDEVELKFSNNLETLSQLSFEKIFRTFKIAYSLIKKCITFRPNFIYFTISPANNTFYRDLLYVLIIKVMRVHPIYHLHGKGIADNITKHGFLLKIYRWVFNNATIIHLSDGLLASEITPLNLTNTKTYTLQNGIKKVEGSSSFKLEEKEDDILFLSNLFPSKGIFVLLEALQLVVKKRPLIKVNIVGDTVNADILQKVNDKIESSGLKKNVIIHGSKTGSQKNAFFESSKIFVHPTLNDAFPLVILEALQYGLPVISTFEGAIPEIIDQNTGVLLPKNQPKMLADEIVKMLDNTPKLIKMSANCRTQFSEYYSLDRFDRNLNVIFEAILEEAYV
ncbi:glycosyltransferase family 4 protein [Gelidibacter gilvus]|uniref:Glycosyltransferase n=1 Tax=Gelidibacter gilvus TaxID=59602 RepID=A0A4Q0XMK3_9FLAO|nr:glycosyltransferase family 4 protein [Gelidibacter gilvus]RXJ52446.1 glycosyltransferase [Gelidibacter gilvus]